jgi:hypothetical protein
MHELSMKQGKDKLKLFVSIIDINNHRLSVMKRPKPISEHKYQAVLW